MLLSSILFEMIALGISSTNEDNIDDNSKCYREYCYVLIEESKSYSDRSSCSPPYQYLEIYDREMMKDVRQFASDVDAKLNFVELKLDCLDVSTCTWRDSGIAAQYLNWGSIYNYDAMKERSVVTFMLGLQYDWKFQSPTGVFFSTICMRKKYVPTTVGSKYFTVHQKVQGEIGQSKTWSSCKMELLIFGIASGGVHVIAFITIIVLIITLMKNKRQTYSLRNSLKKNKAKQETSDHPDNCINSLSQINTDIQKSKNICKDVKPNVNDDKSFDSNDEYSDYANLNQVKKN